MFELFLFVPYSMDHERQIGTVRYVFFLLSSNLILHLMYIFVIFVVHFPNPEAFASYNCGLMPLLLTEVAYFASKSPDQHRSLLIPQLSVKLRYHVWFLLVMLLPLYQLQSFILLGAIALGWLHAQSKLDAAYNFSAEKVAQCESNCVFSGMRQLAGFVTADAAQGYCFYMDEHRAVVPVRSEPAEEKAGGEESKRGLQEQLVGESVEHKAEKEDKELDSADIVLIGSVNCG